MITVFFLAFEQLRDYNILTSSKFQIHINSLNYTVIGIQQSINTPDCTEDCHLLYSWQLKPEYCDQKSDFIDDIYEFECKTLSFYNYKHKIEDISIIKIESYSRPKFEFLRSLYLLFTEKTSFFHWKEQPHMLLLSNKEWFRNDNDHVETSNKN